jgi:hypothetical protein
MEHARHLLLYHYLLLLNHINVSVQKHIQVHVVKPNYLVHRNVVFIMGHVKEMLSLVILNVYARLIIWDRVVNEVFFKIKIQRKFFILSTIFFSI